MVINDMAAKTVGFQIANDLLNRDFIGEHVSPTELERAVAEGWRRLRKPKPVPEPEPVLVSMREFVSPLDAGRWSLSSKKELDRILEKYREGDVIVCSRNERPYILSHAVTHFGMCVSLVHR